MGRLEWWKIKVRELKMELWALSLAARDPRVPWYVRLLAICVVGYAFSPIDLIPDPIPVLGYLDDLILLPLGILLVRQLIPRDILNECRLEAARLDSTDRPTNWIAAVAIVALWVILAFIAIVFIRRWV